MNFLDMRTVIISYLISNAICALVITSLCIQNRKRFEGLGFWLADFVMQFIALLLVALRGVIPDLLSMTVSNALVIGGTILLYMGLEHFVGRRSTQWHNLLLLAVFIPIHIYFVIYPNLDARNILFSLGLLVIFAQIAWLMLRRTSTRMLSLTRVVGILFIVYCSVSIARILIDLTVVSDNDFFRSSVYDTLLILLYQMLFIILTFSLFLMVNRSLIGDLEGDVRARIQTEEALKLSEEKFQKAFHSSPDLVTITRARDGQIMEVNEGFSRITGYSREEALNNSSIALELWANPQDREFVVRTLQEGLRVRNVGYDFRSRSGQIINGLFSAEIIQLDNEPHVISVIHDITERKRAEAAIVDLAKFPSENPNPVMRVDGNGVILYANQSSAPILNTWQRQVNQIIPADWQKLFESNVVTGQIREYEMECDGRFFALTVTPLANENYLNIYGRDISERKRTDELMQMRLRLIQFSDSHTLDELLQKTLDEAEILTDSKIGFFHFVEKDQNTLSLQAWSTRTERDFCHAEGKGMHYDLENAGVWVDCVRERRPIVHNDYPSLPNRKGMPTGHAQVLRELVVPVFRDNQIMAIMGVGNKPQDYTERDVETVTYIADVIWETTARKQAEEATMKLNAELEQRFMERTAELEQRKYLISELEKKNEELERFTYTVSHDLRAPLVTIRGFLGYLEKDIQSGNPLRVKSDLDRLTRSADNMQKLLEGLLKLSRAGRTIDHPQTASLETIVRDAINLLEGQINEKGAQVEVADGLPEIYGDPARLIQVLQNLIDNAVKFMGNQLHPRIEIGQRNADAEGSPVFFVKDNGMGIAPEHLERVFGLFDKLDSQAEGTGIGLATVKRVVETHGGRIWVESEGLGKGSTFCFTIPDATKT